LTIHAAEVHASAAFLFVVSWLRTRPNLSDGSTPQLFEFAVFWTLALTALAVMSYVAL